MKIKENHQLFIQDRHCEGGLRLESKLLSPQFENGKGLIFLLDVEICHSKGRMAR